MSEPCLCSQTQFLSAILKIMMQVYAPTIPGFGRSEKPALAYSQTLWLDFLREFVVEVVQQPVVVVGNSIGGFICASLAAKCPRIVKGEVRITGNSMHLAMSQTESSTPLGMVGKATGGLTSASLAAICPGMFAGGNAACHLHACA